MFILILFPIHFGDVYFALSLATKMQSDEIYGGLHGTSSTALLTILFEWFFRVWFSQNMISLRYDSTEGHLFLDLIPSNVISRVRFSRSAVISECDHLGVYGLGGQDVQCRAPYLRG